MTGLKKKTISESTQKNFWIRKKNKSPLRLSLPVRKKDNENEMVYPDGLITTNRSINTLTFSETAAKAKRQLSPTESQQKSESDDLNKITESGISEKIIIQGAKNLQEKALALNLLEEKPSPELSPGKLQEKQKSGSDDTEDSSESKFLLLQRKLEEVHKEAIDEEERCKESLKNNNNKFKSYTCEKAEKHDYEEEYEPYNIVREEKRVAVEKTYFACKQGKRSFVKKSKENRLVQAVTMKVNDIEN